MKNFYTVYLSLISFLLIQVSSISPLLAQESFQVFYETFSSPSFPAGWHTIKDGAFSWVVNKGTHSMEGKDGFAMNFSKTSGTAASNLNIWAFTPGLNLNPDKVYKLRFYEKNTGGGTGTLDLLINSSQTYVGTTANNIIQHHKILAKTGYTLHEYSFYVTSTGQYYIGFGLKNFDGAMGIWIDQISIVSTTGPKEFYNNPTATDLTLPASWGMSKDGSGFKPTNFSDKNQVFKITNSASTGNFSLSKNWVVSGASSKLILGNGTDPFKIQLNDFNLQLDYGATIENSSATNYIITNGQGRLRKGIRAGEQFTLPVGNTTFNPVTIKLAPTAQDDYYSVRIVDAVYESYTNDAPNTATPIDQKYVNRTWLVSEDVKDGSNVSLTLTWNQNEALPGFDPQKCHIKHYENGSWDEVASTPATNSGTTYSVSRADITSFSPFTTSSFERTNTTLPVELTYFTAKVLNNAVSLNWATASEKNNDYFTVERSHDGKHFTSIAKIKGSGTTQIVTTYSFKDTQPLPGLSYYRLRQVDQDNSFEYSGIQAVSLQKLQSPSLSIYPNPAQGNNVNLEVTGLPTGETAEVQIIDLLGQLKYQQQLERHEAGPVKLKALSLASGSYLVKVKGKGLILTQKIIVQ